MSGGSITVLEGKGFAGDWPLGLDPATNTTGSANQDYYNAVLGDLFELGPGGKQIDDLAKQIPANGGKIIDPPKEYDYLPGYYAVFFNDPDGLKLELVHVPR